MQHDELARRWAIAWVCLAVALGLHVVDEAVHDFLPLYNSLVESGREAYPWLPFPTFTFPLWIGGLVLGVVLLLALTPLVRNGRGWLRPVSYFLGVLMIVNAIGHLLASLWLGRLAPGVYSSPLLLAAAVALLVTAFRSRHGARGGPMEHRGD